jgi:cation transport ATPase
VGIDDVRAGLLPHEKVDQVRSLQADGTRLAVVGDGVNDAPALAGAHVGVAMGRSGSDLAVESADVVLVRDDLTALPQAMALARRAERVVRANLVIAGSVIVALVAWDVVGTLPLVLGVAGHEGSTVLVALNGMRLLREGAWRDTEPVVMQAGVPLRTPTAATTD